jgi:predicted aspartyl protease
MPKLHHYSFKNEYPNLSFRLTNEAYLFKVSSDVGKDGFKATALWDTGAMRSAITPAMAKSLHLTPIDRVKVNGINNTSMADVVNISIGLPNLVMVKEVDVMVCNLVKDIDLLIGMDIILLGDFSISNGDGKTLFSFVIPPFENKTDYCEKAIAINKRNKV